MKTINQKIRAAIFSLTILILPTVVYAAGLIPCGDIVNPTTKVITNPCEFKDIVILIDTVIHFLMYDIAVPLAALGFMWAGANLVLSQNKESAWSDAKSRFGDIALGFGIMLGAYLLIRTVIFAFLSTEQKTFMQFMFS